MAIDYTHDKAMPEALAALQAQLGALDVSALVPLQNAQHMGGMAARWVRTVGELKAAIARDVHDAGSLASTVPQ